MKNPYIFQAKKLLVSKVALPCIFANLFHVYLNRRRLGSDNSFYVQSFEICCFLEVQYPHMDKNWQRRNKLIAYADTCGSSLILYPDLTSRNFF